MAATFAKPARLELNNTGRWQLLGRFDAADEEQTSLVMDAGETLVQTLHNNEAPAGCPTLRICRDDASRGSLALWGLEDGWRNPETGERL